MSGLKHNHTVEPSTQAHNKTHTHKPRAHLQLGHDALLRRPAHAAADGHRLPVQIVEQVAVARQERCAALLSAPLVGILSALFFLLLCLLAVIRSVGDGEAVGVHGSREADPAPVDAALEGAVVEGHEKAVVGARARDLSRKARAVVVSVRVDGLGSSGGSGRGLKFEPRGFRHARHDRVVIPLALPAPPARIRLGVNVAHASHGPHQHAVSSHEVLVAVYHVQVVPARRGGQGGTCERGGDREEDGGRNATAKRGKQKIRGKLKTSERRT